MNDDGCKSCEVAAYVCNRLRSVRAQACCTDCAMDAPGVLHGRSADDDPKHRGPSWRRGFSDGRLAAFASSADLSAILRARSGVAEPASELQGIASDTDDDVARDRLHRIAAAIRGEPAELDEETR